MNNICFYLNSDFQNKSILYDRRLNILKINPKYNLVLTRNNSTPVRSLAHSDVVSGSVSRIFLAEPVMDVDDVTWVICRLMT